MNDAVYFIEPIISKLAGYKGVLEYIDNNQIKYEKLSKKYIISHISENALFVFIDEDEKRGCECLLKIVFTNSLNLDSIENGRKKFIIYKDLLSGGNTV